MTHVYNGGSTVERDGKIVEIEEDIPPFSLVVLGKAGEQTASTERDEHTVWTACKPGKAAPLYRPELLAVNGPVPIWYRCYGEVSQAWPQRVAVASKGLDQAIVHRTIGVENDSWLGVPDGGVFTCLGLDVTWLREQGAKLGSDGQWTNLPEKVLVWIAPRLQHNDWANGWMQKQALAQKDELTPAAERIDPVRFRLQQPYVSNKDAVRLYEPIADKVDHQPTKLEDGMPVRNAVGWWSVRDAGTYLVTFSAKLDVNGYWLNQGPGYIGLGLFGGRPNRGDSRKGYTAFRQPAVLASRQPVRIVWDYNDLVYPINGRYGQYTIPAKSGVWAMVPGYNPNEDDPYAPYGEPSGDIWGSEENVCTSAIVELKAGWILGVLKIGQDAIKVEHFALSIHRLGPASDPEMFWRAIEEEDAWKVDWADD